MSLLSIWVFALVVLLIAAVVNGVNGNKKMAKRLALIFLALLLIGFSLCLALIFSYNH